MVRILRVRSACLVAILAAAALTVSASADVIALNNGDRVTGTIDQITPTTVQISTAYAGKITLQRAAIRSLASDHAVAIVDEAGTSHTAIVGPTPGNTGWKEVPVAAADPNVIAVPYVAAPVAAPAPKEPESIFGPNWKNQLALGLVNSSGNTDQTEFNGEASFHYQNKPHELTIKFDGAYGTTNGTQDNGMVSAEAVYRRELPDWKPADRWFFFGETHNLYDALKGISYRSIDAVGLGFYAWRGEKLAIDLRAGPGGAFQRDFNGHSTSDFDALAGLRATYKFNERVGFVQELLYSTALSNSARYQFSSDSALDVKLPEVYRGFGLKVDYHDDYDNTASADHKRNDTRFIVALTLDY